MPFDMRRRVRPTPVALFREAVGSPAGLTLDPSDFSTMFQDSAGTTPVTAAGDPVGRIDSKVNGVSAVQSTNNDFRPTLGRHPDGGIRNLLDSSGNLSDSTVWTAWSGGVTVTSDSDGYYKLSRISTNTNGLQQTSVSLEASRTVFASAKFKAGTSSRTQFNIWDNNAAANLAVLNFNWVGGVPSTQFSNNASNITYEDLGGGEYRVSYSSTTAATVTVHAPYVVPEINGSGTEYVFAKDFQVEYDALSDYQERVDQYDITEAGKRDCWYLDFDGVDDYLQVSSLNLSGTDKVSVFAGVHVEDNSTDMIVEASANAGATDGAFHLAALSTQYYQAVSRGTATSYAIETVPLSAPKTNVVGLVSNVSGDTISIRVDGSVKASSAADQGTGDYGSHDLHIGARAGSSLFLNGRIYSLTVVGKLANATEVAATERHAARKSGVTL